MKALTQAQFEAVNDKIDALLWSRNPDPTQKAAERAKGADLSVGWEAACALPVRTAQQREDRLAAIAAFAVAQGLL